MPKNVLIIGDICIDRNIYGKVTRLSPEAPVPIFEETHWEQTAGMSGNVFKNCLAAGDRPYLISAVGSLYHYESLGFSYKNSYLINNIDETIKTRYYGDNNHYMFRVDHDNKKEFPKEDKKLILAHISKLKQENAYDIVILQDYAKGFFDKEFIQDIIKECKMDHRYIPILVDGNKARDMSFYANVNLLKINEDEFNKITSSLTKEYSTQARVEALFKHNIETIIITKGSQGSEYFNNYDQHKTIKAVTPNLVDVTGAGDTFIAYLAHAYSHSSSIADYMKYATAAAGLSVSHKGCYAPTLKEVEDYLKELKGKNE